ncbi:hypothetical protein SAMN02990966_07013 [Rhodospirillales bacterium URHD0017]|nr:hypothetical protein SAMN02990966_07013 [Rhodospirillales bacterium URHD0017]
MGTPRPRRATTADTAAVAALSPAIIPTDAEDRAVFVIDGATGPTAAIDLRQMADHISVDHLVGGRRERRRLLAHAAAAARTMGLHELRWPGFPSGRRHVRNGPLQRAGDYLDNLGVPVWRDGTASLPQTLYFRGTWAAVALLIGFGSISAAVFLGEDITLAHIAIPAVLCAIATVFAIFQIGLLTIAARRIGGRGAFAATSAAAAAALLAIGALLIDRAAPTLVEMWAIYTGDVELNQLAVRVSADGSTLYVEGSYGLGGETTVRRALDQNPGIRTVVLAGPGGRISVGFELYELFRERKLATRVDDECASACTIAFLGGVERSISPGGRLGFHRGSFPGLSDNDMYESNRDFRRFLLYTARLTAQFVDRVFATPPDDIWEPTPQELLAGRVINRVNH